MIIAGRQGMMGGKKPYDAEVEYLESTGTQWIDTGINAKQSLEIKAVFETNSTTSNYVYGVRSGSSTIACASGVAIAGSPGYARWGADAYAAVVPTGLVSVTQGQYSVIVNGMTHRYNAKQEVVEQRGFTMVIFAGRTSATSVALNATAKLYSFLIADDYTVVRQFIPVRVGNVGYLYDKISCKLFGNNGTGAFIVGPDL